MDLGPLVPILIVMSIAFSIVAVTWIRAKHGYPLENDDGTVSHRQDGRSNAALEAENKELKQQMGKLLDRVAVLERIATDPAERTAREIESLRAAPVKEGEKRDA